MLLLLYVHVCVTRTGWKTRPRPKTVILLIKQSNNQSINQSLPPPFLLFILFFSQSLSLVLSLLSFYFVPNVFVLISVYNYQFVSVVLPYHRVMDVSVCKVH